MHVSSPSLITAIFLPWFPTSPTTFCSQLVCQLLQALLAFSRRNSASFHLSRPIHKPVLISRMMPTTYLFIQLCFVSCLLISPCSMEHPPGGTGSHHGNLCAASQFHGPLIIWEHSNNDNTMDWPVIFSFFIALAVSFSIIFQCIFFFVYFYHLFIIFKYTFYSISLIVIEVKIEEKFEFKKFCV